MNKLYLNEKNELKSFESGMKNDVSRIWINNSASKYVKKQFPKYKSTDKINMFEAEVLSYQLLKKYDITPELIDYDSENRFIILSYLEGNDLNNNEIGSNDLFKDNIESIAKSVVKLYDICSLIDSKKFRKIDLKQDLMDGINLLFQNNYLKHDKKILYFANNLELPKDHYQFVHGSLNSGNIIFNSLTNNCKFVDFELAANAPSFYDMGFFITRNNMPTDINKEFLKIISDLNSINFEQFKKNIEIYRIISSILLMGLDGRTLINKKSDKISNRFNIIRSNLNNNLSDSIQTKKLLDLIYKNWY